VRRRERGSGPARDQVLIYSSRLVLFALDRSIPSCQSHPKSCFVGRVGLVARLRR
jgi:hypothetical protein